MIAAMVLLVLTGVLAFLAAAVVGWQLIACVIAGIIVVKLLRKYAFKN